MAPHTLSAPTGPHKTQNSVVAKPSHPSFAMEAVATTPPDNYGLLKPTCLNRSAGLTKVFSGTGMDQACFLGTLQLHFADQANFSHIADQQGLYEALVSTMQCLDHGATNDSLDVKAFFSFADAIIWIETNHCEACKREVEELCCCTKDKDVDMLALKLNSLAHHFDTLSFSLSRTQADPNSKPKTTKVKVSPALANHTPSSNAVLALLSQVDATLEATQLAEDGAAMPYPELQKHCDAVDLAAQHQLIFLDLSLQTFKMISECLNHLNKALGPSNIEQTGAQFHELQVSSEAEQDDLDVEFTDPSLTDSSTTLTVSETSLLST
ncbi:hypothetical protein C0995_005840 [Termitomyces sp. Mi166|nr:hypothetical protein C0995_005840 [Termitomyces sp. Mi166\